MTVETVFHHSLRQEWRTPDPLYHALVKHSGGFTVDAAASLENALCPDYIDQNIDALKEKMSWSPKELDRPRVQAFCNPGFRNFGPWIKKAFEQGQTTIDSYVYLMGLSSFSSQWWRQWAEQADRILLLSPRVNFLPPLKRYAAPGKQLALFDNVEPSSNPRETCVFIFRPIETRRPVIETFYWKEPF